VKLSAYVLGGDVAVLEPDGDFRSVLTYRDNVAPDDFVSLTMPVRTESYAWDDVLHPIFQMNLPEGYLLQVLQEQLGPQVTGSPMALLSGSLGATGGAGRFSLLGLQPAARYHTW
jgi:serine/threonine-protein kinase HipA